MLKCRKTRENYFRLGTEVSQELFLMKRKNCKKALQEEERKFMNNILQNVTETRSLGRVRNCFITIKQYKQFNPICKTIKNQKLNKS